MFKTFKSASTLFCSEQVDLMPALWDGPLERILLEEYLLFTKQSWKAYSTKNEIKRNQIKSKARKHYVYRMFSVELPIFYFLEAFPEHSMTVANVWSILPGYNSILPPTKDRTAVDVLRLYFKNHMTRPIWEENIRRYKEIPSDLRIFQIEERKAEYEGKIQIEQHIRILNRYRLDERRKGFCELLMSSSVLKPPPTQGKTISKTEVPFVYLDSEAEERKDRTYIRYKTGDRIRNGFPPFLLKEQKVIEDELDQIKVPSGRSKVPTDLLSLPLSDKPWNDNVIPFVDSYRSKQGISGGTDMRTLQQLIHIKPTDPSIKELRYGSQVGVVGIVGAGKSVMMQLETIRLTNLSQFTKGAPDAKVAIWTENVAEALMFIYHLHQRAGIEAVPIIGKKDMIEKHLRTFMKKLKNETDGTEINPLSDLSLQYVLRYFVGDCALEVMNDLPPMPKKACRNIRVEKNENGSNNDSLSKKECLEKRLCPLYDKCGMYASDRHLREAKVWVGTEKAFLHSRPMPLVNPLGLTYAEIAFQEMDVIFVDEADNLQSGVEDVFFAKNKLFGDTEETLAEKFQDITGNVANNFVLSGSDVQMKWLHHASEVPYYGHLLFHLYKTNKKIRERLEDSSFALHTEILSLTKGLYVTEHIPYIKYHPFFMLLSDLEPRYLEQPDLHDPFKIEQVERIMKLLQEIKAIVNNSMMRSETFRTKALLGVVRQYWIHCRYVAANWEQNVVRVEARELKEEKEEQRLIEFLFFVLLWAFDYHIKRLIALKHKISEVIPTEDGEIPSIYSNVYRYLAFMPDSPLGKHFQYHFSRNNEKPSSVGILSSYDYLGVGRSFFTRMGSIYEHVLGKETNTNIMYVSATMYAKKSKHYHVHVPLSYLICPTQSPGRVTQKLLPQYENEYETDGKGHLKPICISGEKKKDQKLMLMTKQLIPSIQKELAFWEKTGRKRKVLLVVNSYNQVAPVMRILEENLPGRAYALRSAEDGGDLPFQTVYHGELEKMAMKQADILVTPVGAMNRGYNILQYDEEQGSFLYASYFGSVFFLVRPYIPYNDIHNVIGIINGFHEEWEQENASNKDPHLFAEGIMEIRRLSYETMERILSSQGWSRLDSIDRTILGWYTLINTIQMVGRLLRGQTDAHVFYCDGKFALESAKESGKPDTEKTSMLKTWVRLLEDSMEDPVMRELYGYYLDGLQSLWKEE